MATLKHALAVTALLLAGLTSASSAFAVDYFWGGSEFHSGSALGACTNYMNAAWPSITDKVPFAISTGRTSAGCGWDSADYGHKDFGGVSRSGDGCPINTTENTVNGECIAAVPPKDPGEECDDQTGGTASNPMIWDSDSSSCKKFTDATGDAPCQYIKGIGGGPTAYTVSGTISSTGQAVAPPSFTDSTLSCAVSTVATSSCTVTVAGAVSCNVTGLLTGHANESGEVEMSDAICPNGICTAKEPKTQTKDEPCVPAGNGAGGTSCSQTKETTAEGSQQCGSFNGAYTCTTKKPASNGITTAITATSETLPDGSVKVTTVKNSTATICSDVNTCTTQTSTTTQHSTTTPTGTTKTDTTCTGSCTGTGGGLDTVPGAGTGTGNGPGTGGGTGTCTGDDCGEGGDGTASTTDDCAAPPPCDGDPFQCAILQQAHLDTCKLMAMPSPSLKAEWDAKIAKSQSDVTANQAAMDTQVNTLLGGFTAATSGGGTGGGKCLPDIPFSVMGHTMDLEFSKTCDSISFIRLATLAMAYLFAARIVFKEV